MSEQGQPANPVAKTQPPSRGRWRLRYGLILLLVALVAGFTGAVTAKAWHFRNAMWGGPLMVMGPADADEAEEHATWMMKRLARHVNATPEQKTKLTAIATAAARDLFPLREKMIISRRQAIELLRQPTINRDEIEKLRAERVVVVDIVSKRLAQALGDMADVLTLEQRKGLADDFAHFARHWGGPRG